MGPISGRLHFNDVSLCPVFPQPKGWELLPEVPVSLVPEGLPPALSDLVPAPPVRFSAHDTRMASLPEIPTPVEWRPSEPRLAAVFHAAISGGWNGVWPPFPTSRVLNALGGLACRSGVSGERLRHGSWRAFHSVICLSCLGVGFLRFSSVVQKTAVSALRPWGVAPMMRPECRTWTILERVCLCRPCRPSAGSMCCSGSFLPSSFVRGGLLYNLADELFQPGLSPTPLWLCLPSAAPWNTRFVLYPAAAAFPQTGSVRKPRFSYPMLDRQTREARVEEERAYSESRQIREVVTYGRKDPLKSVPISDFYYAKGRGGRWGWDQEVTDDP